MPNRIGKLLFAGILFCTTACARPAKDEFVVVVPQALPPEAATVGQE